MRKDHINCNNVRMLYVILLVLWLLLVLDEGCLSVSVGFPFSLYIKWPILQFQGQVDRSSCCMISYCENLMDVVQWIKLCILVVLCVLGVSLNNLLIPCLQALTKVVSSIQIQFINQLHVSL